MAFLSKLRERLFKSSSKLDEGLQDLVGDTPAEAPAPAEPERPASPATPAPAPARNSTTPEPAPGPSSRPGLVGRLFGATPAREAPTRILDDAMLMDLEDLLIRSDMGVDTATRVTANIAEGRMGRRLSAP